MFKGGASSDTTPARDGCAGGSSDLLVPFLECGGTWRNIGECVTDMGGERTDALQCQRRAAGSAASTLNWFATREHSSEGGPCQNLALGARAKDVAMVACGRSRQKATGAPRIRKRSLRIYL
jgi:hypothetical protein